MRQNSFNLAENQQIAIISDVHANFFALSAAWDVLQGQQINGLVFLGDLLTYGCDPIGVINLMNQIQQKLPIFWIYGNHDMFYLEANALGSYKAIPGFVSDSIAWTKELISSNALQQFSWVESIVVNNCILLAHANPFPFPDWTYLRTAEDFARASTVMASLGRKLGIFGHVHREKWFGLTDNQAPDFLEGDVAFCRNEIMFDLESFRIPQLLTLASVGQPRGSAPSVYLLTRKSSQVYSIFRHQLQYEEHQHLQQIKKSSLSDQSKERLLNFFER